MPFINNAPQSSFPNNYNNNYNFYQVNRPPPPLPPSSFLYPPYTITTNPPFYHHNYYTHQHYVPIENANSLNQAQFRQTQPTNASMTPLNQCPDITSTNSPVASTPTSTLLTSLNVATTSTTTATTTANTMYSGENY